MRYYNNNHTVNRTGLDKTAGAYDHLMQSNRQLAPTLNVSTFNPAANESLRHYIQKQSFEIGDDLEKNASTKMQKEAFLSNGLDLFTKTRNLISKQLGVSEDVAHDITSPVLTQAGNIQSRFGGTETEIIEGIVQELGPAMMQNNSPLGKDVTIMPMKNATSKELLEYIEKRLINEIRMSVFEAERYKHAVAKEAKDLTTILRPHDKVKIANAIIDLMYLKNEPRIVYGLKDSTALMGELRNIIAGYE